MLQADLSLGETLFVIPQLENAGCFSEGAKTFQALLAERMLKSLDKGTPSLCCTVLLSKVMSALGYQLEF